MKKIKTGIVMLSAVMSISFGSVALGAEGQSARWVGSGDRWQVSDNNGGVIKNCWFQDDITGHWYMLGAEDGTVMYAGLVTDNSTGKTYLLNTNHDGTYGRMITADGTYNLNGRQVTLSFDQEHNGSFGAITIGLDEARASGVAESKRDSIPVAGNEGVSGGQQQSSNSSYSSTAQMYADLLSGKTSNDALGVTEIDGEGLTVGDVSGYQPMR